MNLLLLFNLVIVFCIVLFLLVSTIKTNFIFKKYLFRFLVVVFFNLVMFLAILSWVTGYFKYSSLDFAYIYSFVLLAEVVSFSIFSSVSLTVERLFYVVYFLSLFVLLFFNGSIFILTTILFMYFLVMSISGFFSGEFSKTSLLGLFFSSIGVIYQIVSFFRVEYTSIIILLLNVVFFLYLILFFKELLSTKFKERKPAVHDSILDFLKYFIFIIIVTNLILIATLGLHELGHFFFAFINGCTNQRIIFEAGALHTDVLCNGLKNVPFISGGIFFPIIIAVLLFICSGKALKGIAILVIGFDIMASFRDFQDLGLSSLVAIVLSIIGVALMCVGIFVIIKSRIDEHMFHLSTERELNSADGKH